MTYAHIIVKLDGENMREAREDSDYAERLLVSRGFNVVSLNLTDSTVCKEKKES